MFRWSFRCCIYIVAVLFRMKYFKCDLCFHTFICEFNALNSIFTVFHNFSVFCSPMMKYFKSFWFGLLYLILRWQLQYRAFFSSFRLFCLCFISVMCLNCLSGGIQYNEKKKRKLRKKQKELIWEVKRRREIYE